MAGGSLAERRDAHQQGTARALIQTPVALEHQPTWTRDSEPVSIPGGRCGTGAHSTVGAVVPDEVFEVGKVLGLAIHGRNL
jgi:hypothetical protein